jgi:hypothetical protein
LVVSASRRTDLPAHHADWLAARIREGSCLVRNPFDARRIRTVSLLPEDLDCLVLWTRDPRPLLHYLPEFEARGIRYYVHMTLTGYPAELEPGCPRPEEALAALASLSDLIGPERLVWRYDPLFVAGDLGPGFHLRNLELLSARIEGRAETLVLSLLDEYGTTRARLARAGFGDPVFGSPRRDAGTKAAPPEPYPELLAAIAGMAAARGFVVQSCAEPFDLEGYGIRKGACIDALLIRRLFGLPPGREDGSKDSGQRPACGCAPSVDIGSYGSCPAGCVYCYARRGR